MKLDTWINSSSLAHLHSTFVRASPFPHIVIPHFLIQDKADALSRALQDLPFERKEADLFSFSQTADLHDCSDKTIGQFVAFLESEHFASFVCDVTGVSVEAGALDLFGSLYESGDYLLCHDDQLEDRKIAYILYLGDDFERKDGGALVLRADSKGAPGEIVERYYPRFNSLVLFAVSKKSWHEVEEVLSTKKRYAIGGWLH